MSAPGMRPNGQTDQKLLNVCYGLVHGRPLACGLILLLAAGCRMVDTTGVTLSSSKYTLEQTEKLQFLDPELQGAVTSTGIQHSTLADGRLQVVVNVHNRSKVPMAVQLSTAFKDAAGFATLDETGWQTLSLRQNSTEAVRFVSSRPGLRQFTIRVRHSPQNGN
ncbi:MAG: DUF1425 domain-containing protein [Opitutaceae bacterium]|nr:DUF1425 domain-containing protein [Opitutaceae bacterium]